MSRVLIADDQEPNRYMLEALLRGYGYEVTSARDGAEALRLAHEKPPDLIVTDILMPVMDGFDLCRHWKTAEDLKDIPFVFYTATYTDPKDEQFALGLGADRYVIKPAEPEVLARVVGEVLGEARKRRPRSFRELFAEEAEFLREHNEVLSRKLEHKMAVLETEIADRRRAELALRESEEFFESIVENIPDMVFVKAANDLRFIRVNKAGEELLGYSRAELSGKDDHDFFPPAQADHFTQKDREALATRKPLDIPEETIQTRHRGTRLLRTKKIPIFDGGGNPRFVLGISEDITERRRLEDRLRQSEKMEAIGLLAGGVAHDFNNLLGVIVGHGDLLSLTLPKEHPARSHVEMIQRVAQRGAGLTRQLLAFSRQQVVEPRSLELGSIVQAVEKMLQRVIGEHVELVTRCPPTLWPVFADQGQIEQVIMNLAINARDAMPSGGQLVIETRNAEVAEPQSGAGSGPAMPRAVVALSVSDTGVGMSEETRARLFEPFFTTKPPGKGTGLGLTTVHEIVKQSGGWIDVASTVGRGTTFTVYLPRASRAAAEPASAVRQEDDSKTPRGSETILLVEDEAALGVVMTEVLEEAGYSVIHTESPNDAVKRTEAYEGTVHLLLTDVVMPEMNGPQLAARVRSTRPDARILFMSGYPDDALGLASGGVGRWIGKPFSQDQLLREVRKALDDPAPSAGGGKNDKPELG